MRRCIRCLLLIGLSTTVLGNALAQPEPKDAPVLPEKLDKLTLTIDPGRHNTAVQRVFFNPSDGNQLITLADDGAIRLWDVAEARTVKVIYPPGVSYVRPATMSQDGKRLALPARYLENGKEVHVIYVLSLPDGRLEKVLRGHPAPVRALAFTPDGQRLASHSTDKEGVWLSNLTRDDPPEVILKGKGVTGLAFSPDGQRLAWVRKQSGAILDLTTKMELDLDLKSKQEQASCHVAWSPDGKTLATATVLGGDVRLHDAKGKLLHSIKYPGYGEDLRFSPDSKTVLVVGRLSTNHHRATLFDVETAKELVSFSPKGIGAAGGAFSPDGQLVATVGGLADWVQIFVWRAKNGEISRQIKGEAWMMGGAAFEIPAWSKDGKGVCWLSSGRKDRTLKNPLFGFATFDLAGLGFVETLDKEQRHEPILDKDGVMEKDGLSLKRSDKTILVFKDGKQVRRYGCEAAALLGNGLVALRQGKDYVYAANVLTNQSGRLSPDGRYLMTGSTNTQKLAILRADQEKPLLTLYRKGQDWIIWTEEGYYAATPGGERLMGWKVDNGIDQMPSFYPVERFRKQLYRPDVIKLVLEKGSVEEALKAANAALPKEQRPKTDAPADVQKMLPPTVTLTLVKKADDGTVTLRADAKPGAKEQPIQSLRVMVGGHRLPESQGFSENKESDTWTLTLPPGKHRVLVLARSADASAISNKLEIDSRPLKEKPVMHVLAIGIDQYQDKDLNLSCAVNDANLIANTFEKECQGELFEKVGAKKLLNEKATRDQVLKEVRQLRTTAKSGDLVVVFFAGHGAKQKDQFYLLTHEALVDDLAKTTLSGATLREELKEFPCQVLLLLDACHSAGFGAKGKLAKKDLKPATDDATRTFTDDEVGVVVMCAAMGYEKAEERGKNGLFTQALVEALTASQPAQQRKGQQYVHHLHSYVFDKVADKSDDKQHPFLHLPWTIESFPLRKLPEKSPGTR